MITPLIGSKRMAELLEVSPDTIRRLAETGEIPAVRVGRFWRFDADEVVTHLKTRAERRDPWARPAAARRALHRRKTAA